jgi:hypothetical protein
MILSDDEIKAGSWSLWCNDRLRDSHLEVNTKIRKLEAKLQELGRIVDAYFEGGLGQVDAMKQVTKIMDRREE